MLCRVAPLFALAILATACQGPTMYLPDGDPAAGKVVFEQSQCYGCHLVEGASFPEPTAITPTFVTLGKTGRQLTRPYLIESIIAPSHSFATPQPPEGEVAGDRNIRSGQRSRMTDYSDQLTVKELFDLVAYLEDLQGGPSKTS